MTEPFDVRPRGRAPGWTDETFGVRQAEACKEDLSGQHFIVFVENPARVIIVEFLPGRSDLPGKLAALREPEPARTR